MVRTLQKFGKIHMSKEWLTDKLATRYTVLVLK